MNKVRLEIKKDLRNINNFLNFAIIRNYEFLFDQRKQIERDLDILAQDISTSQINKIKEQGYWLASNSKYRTTFAKYFTKEKIIFFLDFHKKNVTGNPISYDVEKSLLKNKKKKNGIPVARDEEYLVALLMRELLAEGFRKKYRKKIIKLYNASDKKEVAELLSKSFGRSTILNILKLINEKDFSELDNYCKSVRFYFVLTNLISYAKSLLYLKPTSKKFVSIIGIDGSGKTTIIENCYNILIKNGISVKKFYMGRGGNNVLPVQKPAKFVKDRTVRMPKIIKTAIYSSAAFLYVLDFRLRFHKAKKSKENIILTDRFSSDILLMPNVPKLIRRFLYLLSPKSNLYIYLYNDLSVLKSRRAEHSLKDMQRQEKEFEWINRILNSKKIKNQNIKNTMEEVLRVIL